MDQSGVEVSSCSARAGMGDLGAWLEAFADGVDEQAVGRAVNRNESFADGCDEPAASLDEAGE